MITKPFDSSLHHKYDQFGRDKVIQYLSNKYRIDIRNNPNIYGVDLIAYRFNKPVGYIEVEVRESWSADQFPFTTLHIPFRKKKLLENDLKTLLISVNAKGNRAFLCEDHIILSSPVKKISNKYILNDEMFYDVDIKQIKLLKIA